MSITAAVAIVLKHPVKCGDETLQELRFRRPNGGDMRAIGKTLKENEVGAMLDMAARLTGQPETVIDRLDLEDVTVVLEVVAGFLPSGPATSKTS